MSERFNFNSIGSERNHIYRPGVPTRVRDDAMKGFVQLARVSTYQLKSNELAQFQRTSSNQKKKEKKEKLRWIRRDEKDTISVFVKGW